MLTIEIAKSQLNGGHIGIMLFIEDAKIVLNGGHIGIMLCIKITKKEINRRPYSNYTYYRDC